MLKPAYIMSESHLGGYRVILGFNTLAEAQEAHAALSSQTPAEGDESRDEPNPILSEEAVGLGEIRHRLGKIAEGSPIYSVYSGPPQAQRKGMREDLRLILSALPVVGGPK